MRLPAFVLTSVLLLAACGETAPDSGNGAAEKTGATAMPRGPMAERLEEPAALKAAFALAFADPAVKVADDIFRFRPAALYRFKDRLVLLSEASGPDCHACSGLMAVHYLTETPQGMKITQGWIDAIPGSDFGAPPVWTMRTDLMSAPVVQSEANGMAQGYSCRVARLTELLPAGPKVRAERIPLDSSDAGAIEDESKARAVTGAILPIGPRDAGFTVRYRGVVNRDVPWVAKSGGFVPMADAQDVPQC